LGKILIADIALVGPLVGVFTEVVSQVATLAEYGQAARVFAPEILLGPLSIIAANFDYIVPVCRYPLKVLHRNIIISRGLSSRFARLKCIKVSTV